MQTTVKDLASELGISKVAVNKKIERLGLKDKLIKDGNRFVLPAEVADAVRASYKYKTKTRAGEEDTRTDKDATRGEDPGVYADIIQVLREQLEEKDRQIERLQMLMAQRENNYNNLLEAKTTQQDAVTTTEPNEVTTDEAIQEDRHAEKQSWWGRIFR